MRRSENWSGGIFPGSQPPTAGYGAALTGLCLPAMGFRLLADRAPWSVGMEEADMA